MKEKMEKSEIKDRLFDVLNDTGNLPIEDMVVDDRDNLPSDGTKFFVHVENCGKWLICEI